MNNRLARNAEAEVAGLDDTGVHRADGDFVNAFAADGLKNAFHAVQIPACG